MLKWLFCSHDWKTHAKKESTEITQDVVYETRFWINPIIDTVAHSTTVEVVKCVKCGKFKKITY